MPTHGKAVVFCVVMMLALVHAAAAQNARRGGYENVPPEREAKILSRLARLHADAARVRQEVDERRERARAARRGELPGASGAGLVLEEDRR